VFALADIPAKFQGLLEYVIARRVVALRHPQHDDVATAVGPIGRGVAPDALAGREPAKPYEQNTLKQAMLDV
jgi:hypothetical protein